MDNRAVSETIGIILLFAAIIASVSVAYMMGLPVLQEQSENAQMDSVQDGFKLLQNNMQDHADSGVERRVLRLGVSSGKIHHNSTPSRMKLSVGGSVVMDIQSKPIVYETDDSAVIYDMGMVVYSENNGGSVMISEPPITSKSSDGLYIQSMDVTGSDSISPSRSVAIRSRLESTSSDVVDAEFQSTNLTITSAYTGVWTNYIENNTDLACSDVDSDTIECTSDGYGWVSVEVVEIAVRFDQ